MWKVTRKGLAAHKFRFLLTALAVVLGVAFLSGTFVLTAPIQKTFDDLFADINRGTDAVVRSQQVLSSHFGGGQRPPLRFESLAQPGAEFRPAPVAWRRPLTTRRGLPTMVVTPAAKIEARSEKERRVVRIRVGVSVRISAVVGRPHQRWTGATRTVRRGSAEVALPHRQERLRGSFGGDSYRSLQPEREHLLGIDHAWMAARNQHPNNGRSQSGRRAETSSYTSGRGCANGGAGAGGHSNRANITADRGIAIARYQLCMHRQLLAIHNAQFGDLDPETRRTFDAPGLLGYGDAPAYRLAAPRHHDAVHYQGLSQRAHEGVTGLIVIARERLAHSHRQPGAGGNGWFRGRRDRFGRAILIEAVPTLI